MVASLVAVAVFAWLCVSLWVGFDATSNSSNDALLWGLTVLFGGIAGLFLYFNIGRDGSPAGGESVAQQPTLIDCPHCHAKEDASREVCRFCEKSLNAP